MRSLLITVTSEVDTIVPPLISKLTFWTEKCSGILSHRNSKVFTAFGYHTQRKQYISHARIIVAHKR